MFGIALMELVVEEAEALGPDPEAFRGFYERVCVPKIRFRLPRVSLVSSVRRCLRRELASSAGRRVGLAPRTGTLTSSAWVRE